MNIFLISTVRLGENKEAATYVKKLEEEGHRVHYPVRDTTQDDPTGGFEICKQNFNAICEADEVHIFYHPQSQGIHFDLGIAFCLGKKVKLVNREEYTEEKAKNKSFLRVIDYWETSADFIWL